MRIGVCGTGTIASWISDTVCQLGNKDIVLYACATSPGFDCTEFAEKYGYEKVCGSFDELMQDSAVDLVYIAVPNNFHYDLCMKAIGYGKNLVCEKPFSVRAEECKAILDAAHEKGVFISEALWPAFLPSYRMIKEEISGGAIGELTGADIIMLDNVMFLERVKKLETGGGVLLDEGPYALGCMASFFGTDIDKVDSKTRKLDTGVDAEQEITVTYKDGKMVYIHQSMDAEEGAHQQYVSIKGTKGSIWMDAVANPHTVKILDEAGNVKKELEIPAQITFRGMPPVSGYEHEWMGFEKALREGKKECSEAPNAMTLCIAQIMSGIFENAGIKFPF